MLGVNEVLLIKISYVVLGLLFLNSARKKVKKPYLHFIALKDYKMFSQLSILNIVSPLLIAAELLLALLLLVTIYSTLAFLLGIILQVFNLVLIVGNLNTESNNNCGCFEMNMPKKVTTKHLAINMSILVFLIVIYCFEYRINNWM
ncbi:Methylamine utilization protein MauE [compost metagenome]